ncbi:carbamoyl-phosphate synthase large subunit [Paucidesulfovibrio gracilis DSM 16080]|uniref:Carbamoyl phosphate synthase large chain n=1 Tax=Paucidesulfovibrio gracilis DSM 16080 TaxID=1121449 RepID=A0A1T4WSD6_9BACT|nr:carbamoyl-phosphate synthase large subunit [Paucidesulfovibrio gracilis]SKA79755.1 carbamoyl-phosphate synthase large subunit [Paucidesulfovibrio gracilis DSM 16080]
MPKRTDLKKIMLIGSGPIVIGQACEFDYSGTQALKALKEEGYEVVLVNSNPATIMTDPELADRTYVEPIEPETVARIIAQERPDALLPTLGGQTGLNTALAVAEMGVLKEYGVELIGANEAVIQKAESRQLFREAMENIGLKVPASGIARSMDDVRAWGEKISFPIIVRPAYTLGGTGGGVAYNMEELEAISSKGLALSMKNEIMLEQSVLGWKEFELEVMRDKKDNCVIICSIENLDAMGVHTGDSITVAPAQTLTDREYQQMRDAALAIMREIGVETGGSNVQFAVNPEDGELVIIEMNPRVSRSSALASKATGFPIAKIAAKLAVGYTLDELPNDITRETMASFEPTIDYCVIKIPRFTFEKFPGSEDHLTTAMKSVGETMAIGRTFKEALQKGLRSLEVGMPGLGKHFAPCPLDKDELLTELRNPNSQRLYAVRNAMRCGVDDEEIYATSFIDPWFLRQIRQVLEMENTLQEFGKQHGIENKDQELADILRRAKEYGYSDQQLATLWKTSPRKIRSLRKEWDIVPTYYLVDTCAAEFEAHTPYYYSTYESGSEITPAPGKKIIILGGGPNRIGQGIEFDYCCCHSSFQLRDMGIQSIMVNSNPETVSTDYDTSDRLYFEPLTFEDVLNIVEFEQPDGVIIQFGGQTPLNLAVSLMEAGVPMIGTSPDAIDRAEDRERFKRLLKKLHLRQPLNGTAMSLVQAQEIAGKIGFPLVLRPSYVLGGRGMDIVYSMEEFERYFRESALVSPEHPVLIDKFLEHAVEVDVDALADGEDCYIGGVMEHIEEAGIHSGDSACVLPPNSISPDLIQEIERQTKAMALELGVVGLMNVQYAIKDDEVYIIEVNPRASRTVPFVSKATGVPLAKLATRVMLGEKLNDIDPWSMRKKGWVAVKEAVFPFNRFPNVDVILGPEMRSTGEVMGIDYEFGPAFMKAQLAAGQVLPEEGTIFVAVNDWDKPLILPIVQKFREMGFRVMATRGTATHLYDNGVTDVEPLLKVYEGRPNVVDHIKNRKISLVINTVSGRKTVHDSKDIRQAALLYNIPYVTTVAGAKATVQAIEDVRKAGLQVRCLQEYHDNKKQ